MRTLKQLATEALRVQDACNLRAVVNGFGRALDDLEKGGFTKGTDALCAHPVSRLWADKIANLTGTQTIGNEATMKAYDACFKLSEADGE